VGDRGSLRRAVWVIALSGIALRITIAALTFGTNDVHYWAEFSRGALDRGPVGIYGVDFETALYNHGPLSSWMLVVVGNLADLGLSFPFLIRLPASLADAVTAVVLFELLRGVRGDRPACAAAALFSFCPLGLVVSGFHGNTDPVFVMFVLVSLLMLAKYQNGWAAGVALGLALSVKVVPVVVVGVFAVLAWRHGRRVFRGFVAGGCAVFAVLWVPVLLVQPGDFISHYLGYSGIALRQWGLSQLLAWAGVPWDTVIRVGNAARFLFVALSLVLPAILAWRRATASATLLAGLPLCLLLLVSPAFSTQYLAWALAPSLLVVRVRTAAVYIGPASAFVLVVYSGWSQAPPWAWHEAVATPLPGIVLPLMLLAWLSLAWVVLRAVTERIPQSVPALAKGEAHASV
jgi:hypothetical protein